ncbi:MAG TPA: DNA-binding response regulator [Pseudomonas sp.]|nr:DNA-binding response regulator [Pseudomonas sp.]
MHTPSVPVNDEPKGAVVADDKRWNTRALIVDDDVPIRELLIDYLARFNILATGVTDGAAMRLAMQAETYDVVVLDLMLPGEDGLTLCRWLRAESDIPILMLTARCEPTDRIIGLEMGADDYLSKPFDARELLARVRAVLRRAGEGRPVLGGSARPLIRFAGWQLDVTRRELRSPDEVMIPLSSGEFDLLLVFVEHPQRVLTREQLLNLARGHSHDAFDRSIDVQVSRLRRKLEFDTKRPAMIRTVRNGGYQFTASVSRS